MDDNPMKSTLVSVGELRASQLRRFREHRNGVRLLAAAPGFSPLPQAAAGLYAEPTRGLSAKLSNTLRTFFLDMFSKDLDLLEKSVDWGHLINEWADSLQAGACEVRFFDRRALHTRLISTADSSLLLPDPLERATLRITNSASS
jgi:hypothetical protein